MLTYSDGNGENPVKLGTRYRSHGHINLIL